jgi:hypothetical protein
MSGLSILIGPPMLSEAPELLAAFFPNRSYWLFAASICNLPILQGLPHDFQHEENLECQC